MKKLILILSLILALQIAFKIPYVLALDDKSEIENVITKYLNATSEQDLGSIMSCISKNYHDTKDNKIIDYSVFKARVEKIISNHPKQYIDDSVSDLKFLKIDIQNDKATVEIEFTTKVFNLDTLREISGKLQRTVTLSKETDGWKITQYSGLR